MNTSNLKEAFPEFVEKYGEDTKLQFFFSPAQSLVSQMMPDAAEPGVVFEKNGTIKSTMNFTGVLMVEKESEHENDFEPVWQLGVSMTSKFKVTQKKNKSTGVQESKVAFKSASLDQLIVRDMEGEELSDQAVLITTGFNHAVDEFANYEPFDLQDLEEDDVL